MNILRKLFGAKPKVVRDKDVEPTAEGIWATCSRQMSYASDSGLICETDYCCVDMVASHHWPDASPHAPECTNQEMIDFIGKLQRRQLYMLRNVSLDEILE